MKKKAAEDNSIESITISTPGQEPITMTPEEFKAMPNDLDNIQGIKAIIKGQVKDLLDAHQFQIYKALKMNGNELDISLKVRMKGNSQLVVIGTDISYTLEKVRDGLNDTLTYGQKKLPGMDQRNDTSA